MKRLAIGTGAVAAVVLAAAAVFTAWLVATEPGARLAWRIAARFAPAELEVGAVEGRLIGPLRLHGVKLTLPDLLIEAGAVELEWRPAALARGLLDVERLLVVDASVTRLQPDEPEPDSGPIRLPERLPLPLEVRVAEAGIRGLAFRASPSAEPLVADSLRFGARFDADALRLDTIAFRAPELDVDGHVAVSPGGAYGADGELDFVLRRGDGPPAQGRLAVDGSLDRLVVRVIAEPPYDLEVETSVRDVLSAPSFDGMLTVRMEPADVGLDLPMDAAAARVSFAGGLDDLAVSGEAALTVPDSADVALELRARVLGDAVAVESLRVTEQRSGAALELAGRVELASTPAVTFEGRWSALRWPLDGPPAVTSESGSLAVSGSLQSLRADLEAAVGAGTIEGTVVRDARRLDVDLSWRELAWPAADPRLRSDRGTLAVEGTPDDYRLMLDAALTAVADVNGASGHVQAEGRGTLRGLELDRIDVAVFGGTLAGRGELAWDPALAGNLALAFENLDPGLVSPVWSGRVGGSIDAAARLDQGGLDVRLERIEVAGRLRERPIELDAQGGYQGPRTARVDRLELRSGASSVSARGVIGPELDFQWRVDSPDLADLWPDLGGRLSTTGRLSGPLERPLVEVEAAAAGLAVSEVSVAELRLDAVLDAAGASRSEVAMTVLDAAVAGRNVERLDVGGSGDAAAHTLSVSIVGEGIEADVGLTGGFERPWQPDFAWRFELQRARAAYRGLAPWTLRAASAGSVTAAGIELGETCWESGEAAFCAAAARYNGSTRASFELTELPFAYFAAYLPERARIEGSFGARGELALAAEQPLELHVDATTTRGRIGPVAADGSVPGLAFAPGSASLGWNGERLEAVARLPLQRRQGAIELTANVTRHAGEPFTESAVDGEIRASVADLRFLADILRSVESTAGSLSADVEVSGTVAAPRLIGEVTLENGTVRLREPGISIEDLRVVLAGDGDGEIDVQAAGSSGGGTVEVDGRLSLVESLPVGRLDIRGDAFELFNTPDARVFVSPDLRFDLSPARLALTGDVRVPRAELTPRGVTEGAVTVSSDQVLVDEEETRRIPLSRPLYANVRLTLGDDVSFDGLGLTAMLGGAIEIVEAPGEPVTGSGELRVEEGTYEAYGQELEVRTGRLVFAGGALARPGVDIEAVRRPTEDILVGARVQGTLGEPELSVFSEPSMPRQEQLSYLLLGRPLDSTSSSETSALSRAAMALGLRGGNFLSERLNATLGFDEFGIQTQPGQDTASFVIGKYLTPSLYVSYGIGLFEQVNTLRLRYTISSRWRLVTESSTESSGGDLIYHIERGD